MTLSHILCSISKLVTLDNSLNYSAIMNKFLAIIGFIAIVSAFSSTDLSEWNDFKVSDKNLQTKNSFKFNFHIFPVKVFEAVSK